MNLRRAVWLACGWVSVAQWAGSLPAEAAEIIKVLDRKFPIGKFCPLESRAAASVDLSFVAPASTVRITFLANNQSGAGNWNRFHIDNVTVVAKSVFDGHLVSPVPGFSDCYNTSPPPGQTTGGIPNAPAYDFNAGGTTELLQNAFAATTDGWTGSHVSFDGTRSAPNTPATGGDATGGSLALGEEADGAVQVWASKSLGGLTPGTQYVVFAWWYAFETSPLTIRIGVPCPDQDGDSYVVCGAGCDAGLGQTCGDCNDANSHCALSCTDQDADGWCAGVDCDDTAATCISNCGTDGDADAIADCRDTCIDADGDRYGSAGGGGNNCLGADCADSNRYCNQSCTDADGDTHCLPGDCDDANPSVADELPEVNDCADQQCPGSAGQGVADEISGKSGFLTAGNKNLYSWVAQAGASSYQAVRSSSPTFPSGCISQTTASTSWTDAVNPPAGGAHFYLVRPFAGCKGSWGQRSNGAERAPICGAETACGNGADDDSDGATDCLDPDCASTAPCVVRTFTFVDTTGDNIQEDALFDFFNSFTAGSGDSIFFEISEPRGILAWCAANAAFYRSNYLSFAASNGSVSSGSFSKWRKAPSTGNAWVGPDNTSHLNTFGDDAFGAYSWCSEQFSTEPRNCIFPDRINDCEVYDLATGACRASVGGGTWQLTIRVSPSRLLACGF